MVCYLSPLNGAGISTFYIMRMYRLLRRLWAFPSVFLDKLNKERFVSVDDANIKHYLYKSYRNTRIFFINPLSL
jgi:hypothetical protein